MERYLPLIDLTFGRDHPLCSSRHPSGSPYFSTVRQILHTLDRIERPTRPLPMSQFLMFKLAQCFHIRSLSGRVLVDGVEGEVLA